MVGRRSAVRSPPDSVPLLFRCRRLPAFSALALLGLFAQGTGGSDGTSLPEQVLQQRLVTVHTLTLLDESRQFGHDKTPEFLEDLAPGQNPGAEQDQAVRPFAPGLP